MMIRILVTTASQILLRLVTAGGGMTYRHQIIPLAMNRNIVTASPTTYPRHEPALLLQNYRPEGVESNRPEARHLDLMNE